MSSFVAPYRRPELAGQLGLDLHDIAKSLGAEFKHVKQKLEERGFLDRIKSLGLQATRAVTHQEIQEVTGHSYTREVASYVLDLNAARFFLAKYENAIGDAYLVFLIQRETTLSNAEENLKDPQMAIKFADALRDRALAQISFAQVYTALTASQQSNAAATRDRKKFETTIGGLKDQLGEGEIYRSVKAMLKTRPEVAKGLSTSLLGKQLSKLSVAMDRPPLKVNDPQYGQLNAYHCAVWARWFGTETLSLAE